MWTLAEKGASLSAQDVKSIPAQLGLCTRSGSIGGVVTLARTTSHNAGLASDTPEPAAEEGPAGSENWKYLLLDRLMQLTSSTFERLCQGLLKAAGFVTVQVTGRAGDGGIDRVGQYRLALVSLPVVFQSKRYCGSVGSGQGSRVRGAMAGRGDRGFFITSGNFSPDAARETTREGVAQIDLIDGDRPCDRLLEHRLGTRAITSVAVDEALLQTLERNS